MDASQLDLPSLEVLLSREKAHWEKANRIGKTVRSWEEEEADIRSRYAALEAMSEEDRDVAIVKGHLERAGMLQAVLDHINNVLLPKARLWEMSRSVRRLNAKRNSKQGKKKGHRR
jgi:hypothetical protein